MKKRSGFHYQKNITLSDHLRRKKNEFPWHATSLESLELEMFVEPDPSVQFMEAFSVHSTDELPTALATDLFEFVPGKHLEVVVTPTVIRSDESLKTLKPSERNCFFKRESKLPFFNAYTRNNCKTNRVSYYSLGNCSCVPYNFPRDPNTRVCDISDLPCVAYFWEYFKNSKPMEDFGLVKFSCLPLCESVS